MKELAIVSVMMSQVTPQVRYLYGKEQVECENMRQAYSRAMRNKGAAGVAGSGLADALAADQRGLAGRWRGLRCLLKKVSIASNSSNRWLWMLK